MKVTCPISGITYNTPLPVRGHAIHPHPILAESITCAQLDDWYLDSWYVTELPATETHLLACAYLLKLPLKSVSIAEIKTKSDLAWWEMFWAGNLEKLASVAALCESRARRLRDLPQFALTEDTVGSLPDWITDLSSALGWASQPISEKAKELNRASYKVANDSTSNATKLLEPEQLENLVRRAHTGSLLSTSEQKALPVILSDWALKVTEFPEHSKMRWQRIVQTIFKVDYIDQILMSDIKLEQIQALEAHLMLNTPVHAVGTSHSSILMKRLADVIPVVADFNPTISARKKVNEADLVAALDGAVGSSAVAQQRASAASVTTGTTGGKQLTLSERLAARLANIRGGN